MNKTLTKNNAHLDVHRNFGKLTDLNTGKITSIFAMSGYSRGWLEVIDDDNNAYRLHEDELLWILIQGKVDVKVEPARKHNRIYAKETK